MLSGMRVQGSGWLVVATVVVLVGCQHSRRGEPGTPPEGVTGRTLSPLIATPAPVLDAGQTPGVGPDLGKLAREPKDTRVWPDRLCVEAMPGGGHLFVVEKGCGCNEGLLCAPTVTAAGRLELGLHLDLTRMMECDECFPMVPGRCALPALTAGKWQVSQAGAALFELPVDGAGQPALGCWKRGER
jgi:hypothetical protein